MQRCSVFLVFFCFALAVLAFPTGPGFSELGALALLSAEQLTEPCSQSSDASGAAGCWLERGTDNSIVECIIQHNIPDAISVEIGVGAFGTEGTTLSFFGNTDDDDDRFSAHSAFRLDIDDDDEQEADFLSGNWFIQVRSENCPIGEIRGQLTNNLNAWAELNGDNLVSSTGSNSKGFAVADYNLGLSRLNSFVLFDTPDAVTVELTEGATSGEAGTISSFGDRRSPARGTTEFTDTKEDDLYHRDYFYNIKSETYPSGEIAGVLKVLDATPNVQYANLLTDPRNDNTDRAGCSLISLLCSGEIEYMISHNMENIVSALFIDNSEDNDDDDDGRISLQSIRSPIIGKLQLSPREVDALQEGDFFVVLQDNEGRFLQAEIRPEYPLYSYASGSQETPRVSSFSRGCALFDYNADDKELDYVVFSDSVNSFDSADVREGDFAAVGPIQFSIPQEESVSSFQAGSVAITDSQFENLIQEHWYISLVGEETIRGQLLLTIAAPELCGEDSDSSLASSAESPTSSSSSPSNHYTTYFIFGEDSSDTSTIIPSLFLISLLSVFFFL